jgi:hypothetical protein
MKSPEFQICSTCKHWGLEFDEDSHATNLDQDIVCTLHKKVTDCNYWCEYWGER